eukprot:gene19211-25062_t
MLKKSLISLKRFSNINTTIRYNSIIIPNEDKQLSQLYDEKTSKILFYFTAVWCPPCKKISPVFDKLSSSYPSIKFVKVDIDKFPDFTDEKSVSAVPTFLFVKDGKTVNHFSGADTDLLNKNLLELSKD